MSLGNAPDYPSVEDVSITQKEQPINKLQSFDDFQIYNTPKNQQLLQTILDTAHGNQDAIQEALIPIYQTHPQPEKITPLLQSIIQIGSDWIDSGEIKDHRLSLQKDEIIKQEKAETEAEKAETEEKDEVIDNKEQHTKQLRIAKQKADLIQGTYSEKFQQAQKTVDQDFVIDESQLIDSPLQRDDIAKLLTLQQHPDLADELKRDDDDQQEVLTYLSDGSFDDLKQSLHITSATDTPINTLDDLAHDDAMLQIEGFDSAHDTEFNQILTKPDAQAQFQKLATKITTSLPSLYLMHDGKIQPNHSIGQEVIKQYHIPKEQQQTVLQGLMITQLINDGKLATNKIDQPKQKLIDTSQHILAQSLSAQTSETLKTHTQQNYLSHIATLFGSMGDDIDVDPSTISYDAHQGLTIPFGIDGYQFQYPITVSDTLSGPKILDRHDPNHIDGNEEADTLHSVQLPTMSDLINHISLDTITQTDDYTSFQQSLEQFATSQESTLQTQTTNQKISIQRYATKLKAHLQSRQFATELNTFGQISNHTENYNTHPNQNNQEHQNTYALIDRTTAHNSTHENTQLANSLQRLGKLPQRIKNIQLSSNDFHIDNNPDPRLQYFDMGKLYPNRSHDILKKFQKRGDTSPIDTQDLALFDEYATHVTDHKNTNMTFDIYCTQIAHQTLSPHTQQTYQNDKREIREQQSHQQDQQDLLSLETQLENLS